MRGDPVAADHPPHHALVGEAVQAAALAGANPERVHTGEIPRVAAGEETLLHRPMQGGGLAQPAAAH